MTNKRPEFIAVQAMREKRYKLREIAKYCRVSMSTICAVGKGVPVSDPTMVLILQGYAKMQREGKV